MLLPVEIIEYIILYDDTRGLMKSLSLTCRKLRELYIKRWGFELFKANLNTSYKELPRTKHDDKISYKIIIGAEKMTIYNFYTRLYSSFLSCTHLLLVITSIPIINGYHAIPLDIIIYISSFKNTSLGEFEEEAKRQCYIDGTRRLACVYINHADLERELPWEKNGVSNNTKDHKLCYNYPDFNIIFHTNANIMEIYKITIEYFNDPNNNKSKNEPSAGGTTQLEFQPTKKAKINCIE
jgi:hypothetical protein